MSFSAPKQQAAAPVASAPPPPDNPVTKLSPAIAKTQTDNAIRLGTRSLRIDRTTSSTGDGAGLNLPA